MPDQNQGESWYPEQQPQLKPGQQWPTPQGTYLPFSSHDQSIENRTPWQSAVSQRAANPQAQGFGDIGQTLQQNVSNVPSELGDLAQQVAQGPPKPEGGFLDYLKKWLGGPQGQFAEAMIMGPASSTPAELELLQMARQLKAEGAPGAETMNLTGWFSDPRMKRWMAEHPDIGTMFKQPAEGGQNQTLPGRGLMYDLPEIYHNPALFERAPELLKHPIEYRDPAFQYEYRKMGLGRYLPEGADPNRTSMIVRYNPLFERGMRGQGTKLPPHLQRQIDETLSQEQTKSALAHEFGGHHMSARERFPGGTNPEAAGGEENYWKDVGEVNARAVQSGLEMGPRDLRKTFWDRYFGEYPVEQQQLHHYQHQPSPYDYPTSTIPSGYERDALRKLGITDEKLYDVLQSLNRGQIPLDIGPPEAPWFRGGNVY